MQIELQVKEFQKTGDFSLGKEIMDKSYFIAETIINKKYRGFGYLEDLHSESHDAIVSAIYSFDSEKTTKFDTFCSICINNRIRNFIRKKSVSFNSGEYIVKDCSPESLYADQDAVSALKSLSENHVRSLLLSTGSRAMRTRAKKKFLEHYNNNE